MENKYIVNGFVSRLKDIQSTTKKKLIIKNIYENLICGNFYQLGFGIYYKDSNKKYNCGLFCKDKEINEYIRKLEPNKRKELITEIYNILSKI